MWRSRVILVAQRFIRNFTFEKITRKFYIELMRFFLLFAVSNSETVLYNGDGKSDHFGNWFEF